VVNFDPGALHFERKSVEHVVSLCRIRNQSLNVIQPRLRVDAAGNHGPAVAPFIAERLPLVLAQG
jgi:hypothetical protein